MKKEHIDTELYDILHFTPVISSEVQNGIEDAYEQIRTNAVHIRKKRTKRAGFYLGFAAAVIVLLGFVGFSNPVLAGKIPFIGRIFRLVEEKIGYPGDFSEHSVPLANPETEKGTTDLPNAEMENFPEETSPSNSSQDAYSQTVGDVTITLSEASYTEMALYFSLELYSKEGFPEDFNRVKNMEGYILSYDVLNMQSSQIFDFSDADPTLYNTDTFSCTIEEGLPTPYSIEGNYADSHTFLGVIRIDLEVLKSIYGLEALPPEFTYSFTILKFWGDLNQAKEVPLVDSDTGETFMIQQRVKKYYDGPWSFTIPVSLDETDTQTKNLSETNADGIGISSITKTRYEIKADLILPDSADPADYVIAITDADGKILNSQGNVAEIYSVYGRNTDVVHIYVVDYFTFMDECKAENAYLLPEKALFQTTVEW